MKNLSLYNPIFIFTFLAITHLILTTDSLVIETINAGLRVVGQLLNPPRIFGQDKYANAAPDIIIQHSGYPMEIHEVETPDGYILSVYRIPHGKGRTLDKEPVLLMPGFASSASCYFLLSAEKALPFVLADAGYDVWVGNYRGSEATTHKRYSRNTLRFWHFNVDDIAKNDVPSIIDHILEKTNYSALSYVGYSLGTTYFYMTMASQPSYNQKVRKMVGMAPGCVSSLGASYLKFVTSLNVHQFVTMMDLFFNGEVPVSIMKEFISTGLAFCRLIGIPRKCLQVNSQGFNLTTWLRVTKHIPSPTSARVLAQMMQIIRDERCQMYDYGKEGNFQRSGMSTPESYNLNKVTVPCVGFIGPQDETIEPGESKRMIRELGNPESYFYEVNRSDFSHVDFITDDYVKTLVYDKIVNYFSL